MLLSRYACTYHILAPDGILELEQLGIALCSRLGLIDEAVHMRDALERLCQQGAFATNTPATRW